MHNGLNETLTMGLYYRLASYLIHADQTGGTVCLLRPFPAHLTRSRFYRFAETPLDNYLWDGSHLFRQFLRYMIETQWLLSAIARRSSYRCISGLNLLAEDGDPQKSRLQEPLLAGTIESTWTQLYDVSDEVIKELQQRRPDVEDLRPPPNIAAFRQSVASLRDQLDLTEEFSGELEPEQSEAALHVIGYSLGGFAAQSVFMSWPFLVSSCSTLLSGGALRELAPTAFADPEEWQTVLHSLRYELDDAMIDGRYAPSDDLVAGIDLDLFLFLKSSFYEVFQQEYRGSFQTRLAAFRRRMLFVVGGNDPIVRPQSVLDSGPPDGINMLAIGGLGHFLEGQSRDLEEGEQRSFWLPEIGKLIDRLADDAAENQRTERAENWLDENMNLPLLSKRRKDVGERPEAGTGRLNIAERMAVEGDGALPGPLFERCLDDLLERPNAKRGVLFILRNEVPTVLLNEEAIREHAAVLHHEDSGVVTYIDGLRNRQKLIIDNPERVSLILPWNARTIMEEMDRYSGHPSQSEGAIGQMPTRPDPEKTWKEFHQRCSNLAGGSCPDAVRVCDGRLGLEGGGIPALDTSALLRAARKKLRVEEECRPVNPSLPDCWVWMSPEFLHLDDDDPLHIDAARAELCKVVPERYLDPAKLVNPLRRDQLRMITVSRARYNPRFRGRIVAEPKAARDTLLHVTLCIATSVPFIDYDLVRGTLREAPAEPPSV
jgi:pimeloyl-ACP methyl ester carboxylesterase